MSRRKQEEPQVERRGHPALKANAELAETFGINLGPDPLRELVQVASIPTPPDVEQPAAPGPIVEAQSEDRIVLVIREEMDELGERLARFGVGFNANQKQSVVDYVLAALGGYVGGGAIGRRQ